MPARVSDLAAGDRIRVERELRDFDGRQIAVGTELVLAETSYFPYDDGHTLKLEQGAVIRLSGNVPDPLAVIENPGDAYFVRVMKGSR